MYNDTSVERAVRINLIEVSRSSAFFLPLLDLVILVMIENRSVFVKSSACICYLNV